MRLILFDCDGTIVDSQAVIVSAMTAAFEASGVPAPPPAEILSIVGLSLDTAVKTLFAHHPDAPAEAVAEAYKTAYRDLVAELAELEPLYPGAEHVLRGLAGQEETLLGIVTGKSQAGLKRILGRHGLTNLFATLQTSDDAPSKPHPGMVERALAATGVAPARAVVVGDTTFDMEMARGAGTRAIGVSWGYHPSDALFDAGAETIAHRFEMLPGLVDALVPRDAVGGKPASR